LDLRKGTITGNVRKLAATSRYEIAFVHGVAGTREGIYKLRENGELSVLKGKAFIAFTDGKAAKEVAAGQYFDPATGLIAALSSDSPQAFSQPAVSQTERPATTSTPAPAIVSPVRRMQPGSTGLRRTGF
jgi:hypothetical protein